MDCRVSITCGIGVNVNDIGPPYVVSISDDSGGKPETFESDDFSDFVGYLEDQIPALRARGHEVRVLFGREITNQPTKREGVESVIRYALRRPL